MTPLQHWSAAFISASKDITSSYLIMLPRTASTAFGVAAVRQSGRGIYSPFPAWSYPPVSLDVGFTSATSLLRKKTSERGDEITVAGVVIVRGTIRIDITEISRVARIRRPLPPVVR